MGEARVSNTVGLGKRVDLEGQEVVTESEICEEA